MGNYNKCLDAIWSSLANVQYVVLIFRSVFMCCAVFILIFLYSHLKCSIDKYVKMRFDSIYYPICGYWPFKIVSLRALRNDASQRYDFN